jgi:hypothetical protein
VGVLQQVEIGRPFFRQEHRICSMSHMGKDYRLKSSDMQAMVKCPRYISGVKNDLILLSGLILIVE